MIIWLTGLPGSGKSTIARELMKLVKRKKFVYLEGDEFRKKVVPSPRYTQGERDDFYRKLADHAYELSQKKNVLIDATAHKRKYRDYLRKRAQEFMEIYVKCPLEVCVERESRRKSGKIMAEMYKKALERKRTGQKFPNLGQVIGVDVLYEENKNAELTIESDKILPLVAAKMIFEKIESPSYSS